MARYGLPLYESLAVDGVRGAELLGSLEVAISEARWEELKRRSGWGKSFKIDCELLGPDACRQQMPHLDTTNVLGGLFTPGAGIGRPIVACEALAREAQAAGAVEFHGNTAVMGFERRDGKIRAVLTDSGRIETDQVLVCAGIWGPLIGALAGVTVPLQPMEHLYATFGPIPELAAYDKEIALPIVRVHDTGAYCRMHGAEFGMGVYDHVPLPVDAEAIDSIKKTQAPSKRPFTPEHLEPTKRILDRLFPTMAGKPMTGAFNGMFSFTPDGMPILGEHAEVPGLWLAEAVWFTHGAGVGRLMANWLETGDPGCDVRDADVNRFPSHALTRDFIRKRGAESYINTHAIVHPASSVSAPRNLKRSAFHPRLEALGASFTEVSGWERPLWFEANAERVARFGVKERSGWEARHWSPIQGAEHIATRQTAGLFDLSITAKTDVKGPNAQELLQAVCTADVHVPIGSLAYSLLCDLDGGIRSEVHVLRLGSKSFRLFSSGPLGPRDRSWIATYARTHNLDVTIDDVTSAWPSLGLWGPQAKSILAELTTTDLGIAAFPAGTAQEISLGAVPVLAVRPDRGSEPGFELHVAAEFALALWDMVWEAGQEFGLIAAGTGAIDSLRIETGHHRLGFDIHGDVDPYAAGLEAFVDLAKPDFIGRSALQDTLARPSGKKIACIMLDDPDHVVLGREPISVDGEVVGYVTSSNTGHSIGRQIAFGYLPSGLATPQQPVSIEYFGRSLPGTVIAWPALSPTS
jgi:glycine cleavage system aminomethyltransferase T/glycine/D-amino acid oxidase-like deaminating enzyme